MLPFRVYVRQLLGVSLDVALSMDCHPREIIRNALQLTTEAAKMASHGSC